MTDIWRDEPPLIKRQPRAFGYWLIRFYTPNTPAHQAIVVRWANEGFTYPGEQWPMRVENYTELYALLRRRGVSGAKNVCDSLWRNYVEYCVFFEWRATQRRMARTDDAC